MTLIWPSSSSNKILKRFIRVKAYIVSLSRNIWNTDDVLKCIKSLGDNDDMSLEDLTLKCVLTALLPKQLFQTIHSLKGIAMNTSNDRVLFHISTLLKTSKPGKHQEPLVFQSLLFTQCLMCFKMP